MSADPVALSQFSFDAPQHAKPVDGVIWYPAAGEGVEEIFAETAVVRGVSTQRDAQIAQGEHPVVLRSHGSGGAIRSMAWLAAGLAGHGAIVIAVTHPNTTWSDFDLTEGIKHWTRAQDLSAAFGNVLADARFAGHIDEDRVMAAGFFYGGWAALSVGGATAKFAGMISSCTETREVSDLCARFLSDEVGLRDIDPDLWEASFADPRVTSVAAIEPGFVWRMSAGGVADLVRPVTLIGLGDKATRFIDTDFETSGFAALLREVEVGWIVPGPHFTAMPLCTPAGPAILAAQKVDPVCTDPEGTDRAAVREAIITRLAAQLAL